jgi:hypothetical protein
MVAFINIIGSQFLYADSNICSISELSADEPQCKLVAFAAKPFGGPTIYLVCSIARTKEAG